MLCPIIAPSLLSANWACLGEEAQTVLRAGADWIHIDVMDNHYVPNLTFGPMVCQALRDYGITAPLDVHLMVEPVDDLVIAFAKAGASSISFHPEASRHVDRSLTLIKDHGVRAGLALNPTTSLSYLQYCCEKVNFILLMSVNPGFSGQTFIPTSLSKIRATRAFIDQKALPIRLAVDGGLHPGNVHSVAQAGADIFVVGSAIFDAKDPRKAIQAMQNSLEEE